MGMMSQMPPVEQPSAPAEAGMMGGQQQGANPSLSHGQFNRTVTVNGEPVQVRGGVAEVEGQKFMVSDDGAIVADSQGNLVGHVQGTEFVPADEAYLKQMQEKGYVQ